MFKTAKFLIVLNDHAYDYYYVGGITIGHVHLYSIRQYWWDVMHTKTAIYFPFWFFFYYICYFEKFMNVCSTFWLQPVSFLIPSHFYNLSQGPFPVFLNCS